MTEIRDDNLKSDFVRYLEAHPELRFWQALANWSGHGAVGVSDTIDNVKSEYVDWRDTYHFEGKK